MSIDAATDIKVVRFRSFAGISGVLTMEKSMVSSANNLILDHIFLSRSLI